MSSKKKSLLGIFSIWFIFVLAGVLFAFSISAASETEASELTAPEASATEEALAEDPVSEEAVVEEVAEEPTTDAPSVTEEAKAENKTADPVGGPLTVLNSAGQRAKTDECNWDDVDKVYTIKANALTFIGDGGQVFCRIICDNKITELTLNNVNISCTEFGCKAISLLADNDDVDDNLSLNIVNSCYIDCFDDDGVYVDAEHPAGGSLTIQGDSSSKLTVSSKKVCFFMRVQISVIIAGGISINANSKNANALEANNAEDIIFDTTGNVCLSGTSDGHYAIWIGDTYNPEITVNKGFLELHGNNNTGAAIGVYFYKPSLNLGEDVILVGNNKPNAVLDDCVNGVSMKNTISTFVYLSMIDDFVAGTVFIYNPSSPTGGPLTVQKGDGSDSAIADCSWDINAKTYTIHTSDLIFSGDGSETMCNITAPTETEISKITFDNVNIKGNIQPALFLLINGDLILNFKNSCTFNCNGVYSAVVSPLFSGTTLTLNGDNSSNLTCNAEGFFLGYATNIITGDLSLSFNTRSDSFITSAESLIFDTNGEVNLTAYNSGSAISGNSNNFNLYVNKGFVELHGGNDGTSIHPSIWTKNTNSIINLESGLATWGANSNTAKLEECKEGVYMQSYPDEHNPCSVSEIDGKPAGTVIIGSYNPTPTPGGGESSETAQTWDSVPSAAVALLAIIALSGFVALRTRKSIKWQSQSSK